MKRLRIVYQDSAIDDLQDISLFLLQQGLSAHTARGYVARIRAVSEGGRPRADLATGLRTSAFERRVPIAYRVENETVVIEQVFYGGQDIDAFFARWNRRDHKP